MTKIFFKYLLTAAVMALGHGIHAQLIIDNGVTPVQAVENILLGDGVEAFNITFSGDQNQIGSFNSNNSNIGIGNGMILATGDANVAIAASSRASTRAQSRLGRCTRRWWAGMRPRCAS